MENQEQRKEFDPRQFDWSAVGLDFGNWEEEKLWAMDLPVQQMDINELSWLLDVPFWTDDNNDRWSITPRDVINGKTNAQSEIERTQNADLNYPIDIMENHGKWLVLDGLHRLVKAYQNGERSINVRIVPREKFDEIKSDHPIELPNY